jgi:SAM-dependent methyltransferase
MLKFKRLLSNFFKLNINEKNRDQWLESTLRSLEPGKSILDAGAGEMKYAHLASHLNYFSQDFCQYDGHGSEGFHPGRWNTSKIDIISDIVAIPVPNDHFDYVLCTEVLEHIPSPQMAISELTRVLKPGGKLILTAPFAAMTHFSPYFFLTGFSRFWWESQAKSNKMKIIEIKSNGSYFDVFLTQILIAPGMGERLSGKAFRSLLAILLLPAAILLKLYKPLGGSEILTFGFFIVMQK